ncbi:MULTISPECIES: M23 family metallopeptidase [unclassified Streptomyces]|uniref:M23 family metallopeptidase n=1 Tax=unclassified Streptomyces TaxID=2593676 RepID=UPI001907DF58|nr:M23 family metallopeptidase [Streptomyces sp. HSG2]
MSPRITSRIPQPSTFRARAAVLAAGLGASVALGAGVAVAVETAATTESTSVSAAAPGAEAQDSSTAEAEKAAEEKAAEAEKAAQEKAAEAEKAEAEQVEAEPVAAETAAPAWVDPVEDYTLTAGYAQSGGMWQSTHSGQDFAVPVGTQVVAIHDGTVVKAGGDGAGDGPAYGNAVVIKHDDGSYSQYAHLSDVEVRAGQTVETGQEIAKSGNTGNSSGPHLHFEIRTSAAYGTAVDPVAFLQSKGVTV